MPAERLMTNYKRVTNENTFRSRIDIPQINKGIIKSTFTSEIFQLGLFLDFVFTRFDCFKLCMQCFRTNHPRITAQKSVNNKE